MLGAEELYDRPRPGAHDGPRTARRGIAWGGCERARAQLVRVAVGIGVAVAVAVPAAAVGAAGSAQGAGKPTAGSGINTATAPLDNPAVRQDRQTPYGTLDFVTKWRAHLRHGMEGGTNNGGATYQGVTKDAIKVVASSPTTSRSATPASGRPTNYTTGQAGTVQDALDDTLAVYEHSFGGTYTWPRHRARVRGLER